MKRVVCLNSHKKYLKKKYLLWWDSKVCIQCTLYYPMGGTGEELWVAVKWRKWHHRSHDNNKMYAVHRDYIHTTWNKVCKVCTYSKQEPSENMQVWMQPMLINQTVINWQNSGGNSMTSKAIMWLVIKAHLIQVDSCSFSNVRAAEVGISPK